MCKQKRYKKQFVDRCRNCHGYGYIASETNTVANEKDTCPVCAGSGRIIKVLDIEITITPYCESR